MQFLWLTLAAIALLGFTLVQSRTTKLDLEILREVIDLEDRLLKRQEGEDDDQDLKDKRCYMTESSLQYTGHWNMTVNNIQCQRWDSQTPHEHTMTDPANFPDETPEDAENYCRDPSSSGYLWCYTMDPDIRWFSCGISKCSTECYPTTSNAYSGYKARTASGETCQRWDATIPHDNTINDPSTFPDLTLADAANFCRDPDGAKSPWCYTMNPDLRWEFCSIDQCNFEFQHEKCYHDTLTAKDYNGPWNRTRSGKVCQRWDAQKPHTHSYTSSSGYPDDTISDAENYCRDPSNSGYTWCYTMETGTRWEVCDVTSCAKYLKDKRCYMTESSLQYTGHWDMTVNYIQCQRWDSQTPHKHTRTDPANFPDETLEDAENYCRDPDSTGNLWCYTMDPDIRWSYCGISKCPANHVTCYDSPTIRTYMGTWNKTESGKECQRWDSQLLRSHSLTADMFEEYSLTDAENFCRDPDNSGELWCYTTDPETPIEKCGITKCS